MGLAFVAIVLARLSGGGISDGGGAPSPTPGVTAQASPSTQTLAPAIATPVSSTPATPSLAPGSSAPPSSPRPSTTGTQTYKVKAGDTLIGIAAKFSTTVAAIKNLNGITNASSLKIGQVLQIP
jgi:LysM repeat protein